MNRARIISSVSMGILDVFSKSIGSHHTRSSAPIDAASELKSMQKLVNEINGKEEQYEALGDSELQQRAHFFKDIIKKGSSLDDVLVDAFALVREASWRVLELRHFDVQVRFVQITTFSPL